MNLQQEMGNLGKKAQQDLGYLSKKAQQDLGNLGENFAHLLPLDLHLEHGRRGVDESHPFRSEDPATLAAAVNLVLLKIKCLSALLCALEGAAVGGDGVAPDAEDAARGAIVDHPELRPSLDKVTLELHEAKSENARRAMLDRPLLVSPALLSKAVQELFSIRLLVRNECALSTTLLAPPKDRDERLRRSLAAKSLRQSLLTSEVYFRGRCHVVVFTAPPYAGGGGDELVKDLVEEHRLLTATARVGAVVKQASLLTDAMAMTWRLTSKSALYRWMQRRLVTLQWSVYACVVVLFATASLATDRSHRIAETRAGKG